MSTLEESAGPAGSSLVQAGPDRAGALRRLVACSHLSAPDDLPGLVNEAGASLGAAESVIYVIDYEQISLVPLVYGTGLERAVVAVDGTLPGRAFGEIAPCESTAGDATTLWLPLLDGTDRMGVLQVVLPPHADWRADSTDFLFFASLVAELLSSRQQCGDAVQRARRRLPFSVPAELQWTQLPPLSFATTRVAIAGVLAPTHEVAGDSFDYAVNGDIAHLAILDAMGHGLHATLLSSVATAAMRNARRSGLELVDIVRSMDKQLAAQFPVDSFVTAIVGELNLRTGLWRWVTAGHPPALLVRDGRVVKTLDSVVDLPLGLLGPPPTVGEERLQPGDRLLLHSDGVVEARDAEGEFFGTERLVAFVTREAAAGRPAPETLRRLNTAILAHHHGELQDDATTLLLEWLGDEPRRMIVEEEGERSAPERLTG